MTYDAGNSKGAGSGEIGNIRQRSYHWAITWPARAIATAGFVGHMPVAPGTWGTAVAVPIAWLLAGLAWPAYLAVVGGVIGLAILAAEIADRSWGTEDSGRIVIDEVAGYLVTVAFVDRATWPALAVGFVVFRILDIFKLPPVRALERLPGGAGVVLDDVAAGVIGAAMMAGLAHLGLFAALAGLIR
jgi:phosphatidylglycerophosphatase A